jgi:hypothetical protein
MDDRTLDANYNNVNTLMASNILPINCLDSTKRREWAVGKKKSPTRLYFLGARAWENGDQCGNLEAVGPRNRYHGPSDLLPSSSSSLLPSFFHFCTFFPPKIIYDFSFFFSKNRVGLTVDFTTD